MKLVVWTREERDQDYVGNTSPRCTIWEKKKRKTVHYKTGGGELCLRQWPHNYVGVTRIRRRRLLYLVARLGWQP